jgi:hypothetical protein
VVLVAELNITQAVVRERLIRVMLAETAWAPALKVAVVVVPVRLALAAATLKRAMVARGFTPQLPALLCLAVAVAERIQVQLVVLAVEVPLMLRERQTPEVAVVEALPPAARAGRELLSLGFPGKRQWRSPAG